MQNACRKLILLATAALCCAPLQAIESFTLANDGSAKCKIIVAADASAAEKYAAQELAKYLQKISGAEFQIAATAADAHAVVLKHDPAFGAEEYQLQTHAHTLTITGGRPRGVLYGVYALLAEKLGCRWYTPDCEKLPRHSKLELALDERHKPTLEYREVFYREAFDGAWCARNRCNSHHADLRDEHGGKVGYGVWAHSFDLLLNPAEHFKAHPDYFALVKGQRVGVSTQLCLSHPDVQRLATEKVRGWIKATPMANIFSVSFNDWENWCECESCSASEAEEGSRAGTLLRFVNAIAAGIEKDYPHVAIDTLAYRYTRKPPKLTKPRPNVIVRLCSIECCFSHPLDGCSSVANREFMNDLRGWSKIAPRLYIWDYVTNYAHYLAPHPNLGVLDDNIRTFSAHGAKGVFAHGNAADGAGGELSMLRAWVLAQLLWNPSANADALVVEFVNNVYGAAAPPVRAFIQSQQEAARASGIHAHVYDDPQPQFVSPEKLQEWDELLTQAEKLAHDDAALLDRVQRLRLPIWYTLIQQNAAPLPKLQAAAKRLLDASRAFKLTAHREGHNYARDLDKLELLLARKAFAPPRGSFTLEDRWFSLLKEGVLTELVADTAAQDGAAARLSGNSVEWLVTLRLHSLPVHDQKLLLRVRARAEKLSDAGVAFRAGIFDDKEKKEIAQDGILASHIGPKYQWFEIGTFTPASERYIFIAPVSNAANVPHVYIDRIELVPVE